MSYNMTTGMKVDHQRYGEGTVTEVGPEGFSVDFVRIGKMEFSALNDDFEILGQIEEEREDLYTLNEVEELIADVLEKHGALQEEVPLGDKWEDGTLILQPGDSSLKPQEIPIEKFFHKIIMVRERLRVLEQNINNHSKLTDEDKVNLQQYITRIYGSLTSFNSLFKHKTDHFKGAGS